ncbi:hypothetical protein ABKV19_021434 [Rosa sericea]|uniref:Uncharacterized protein n=1 Tax=Rosa chinensis TaxID=74649 RepID=A0A2P6R9H6_ROSCH|nr:hypothetical protein RchiOBHm_Chr3g0464651 [Rosa chinensis]
MGVSNSSSSLLALVILLVACASEKSLAVEARPLSLFSQQGYSKVFGTLGIACECCDGVGGECKSRWTGSCSSLKCLPWKQHNLKLN